MTETAHKVLAASDREDQLSEEFLTVKEFAVRYGVHIQTVYSAIRYGRFKFPIRRVSDGGRIEILIDVAHYGRGVERSPMGVYFIASGAFVKIGMSSDVLQRVHAIAQATPHHVQPLGYIPTKSSPEAVELERAWHQRFAEYRHRPEWFHASEALLNAIAAESLPWPAVSRESITKSA